MHNNSVPVGDRDDILDLTNPVDTRLHELSPIISQRAIWLNADQHGWHQPSASLPEDLLLIHSEISEACEGYRQGLITMQPGVKGSVEEELADAVIRIFHTAQKNGLDICAAVARKHQININRPYRHGNKKM